MPNGADTAFLAIGMKVKYGVNRDLSKLSRNIDK